jgi:hypothetical protein
MIITQGPDGENVILPMDFEFAELVRGRLPDEVVLTIDERDFDELYGQHAEWVHGAGPYASLAYCGVLTIERYATLESAVKAKRAIDWSGCGGSCARAHLIVYCDAANPEHAAEQQRIAAFLRAQRLKGNSG